MELFAISCTTCSARLKVRSMAAIGQILACPKCASMVQVQPPPGWQKPAEPSAPPQQSSEMAAASGVATSGDPLPPPLPIENASWSRRPLLYALASAALVLVAAVLGIVWWSAGNGPAKGNPVADASLISNVAPDQKLAAVELQSEDLQNKSDKEPIAADVPTPDPAQRTVQTDPAMEVQGHAETAEPALQQADAQLPTEHAIANATTESAIVEPAVETSDQPDDKHIAQAEPVEESPATPPLKRTPPPDVDVQARLADPIVAMEFAKISLGKFVDLLSRMSTIPITFDADALAELNISTDAEIAVRLKDTTVGKALESVLADQKLGYVVAENQIVITYPQSMSAALRRVRYDVSDLVSDEQGITSLAALVQQLVLPGSWVEQGGRGTLGVEGKSLLVDQTDRAHWHVLVFCEKLRLARGRPLRSSIDPARFALTTRYARAKPALGTKVHLNFATAAPLDEIVARLGEAAGLQLLIDGPALAAHGLALNTDARIASDGLVLQDVLTQLTRQLELRTRIVDASVLQLSSHAALADRLELEFHRAADLVSAKVSGDELAGRIKQRLAASSWVENGGSGVLHFDQESGWLLALQSQDVQIRIENQLSQWRAAAQVAMR